MINRESDKTRNLYSVIVSDGSFPFVLLPLIRGRRLSPHRYIVRDIINLTKTFFPDREERSKISYNKYNDI